MAKFKVGDKVRSKTQKNLGVLRVRGVQEGEALYDLEVTDGPKWARVKGWLPESELVLANSIIFNSVRGNTKLKNIDYWFADNGYGDDTLIKYVQSYKKNKCIDFVDRHADTAARDAFYDAMYELTGVKSRWALNSRAINSTNSVVVKALNSVGYNPSDKQDWSIHSVTAHGTWIKKRVHDMTLREAIAEAKKDASKYKYEKVTIYDTVTGKSRHEEKIANSKVAKNASLRKIYSAVKQATQSDMSKAQQMAKSVLAQVKTAVVDLKKVEQSLSVAATSRDNDAIADALIDAYDTIEGMIY